MNVDSWPVSFLTVVSDFNLWISATIPCGPRISPAGPLARRNIKLTRSVVNGRTALRRVVSIALMKDLWDLQRVEAGARNQTEEGSRRTIVSRDETTNLTILFLPRFWIAKQIFIVSTVEVVEEQRNFEFLTRNGPCKLIRFRSRWFYRLNSWIGCPWTREISLVVKNRK